MADTEVKQVTRLGSFHTSDHVTYLGAKVITQAGIAQQIADQVVALLTAACGACSALQHRQMDILKPLGLAPEDVKLPLSPRSEDAYARINEEFDMLYSQLQDPGEQAGQNHAEVCRLSPVFRSDAVHIMPGYAKLAGTMQLIRIQPVYNYNGLSAHARILGSIVGSLATLCINYMCDG